MEAEKRTKAILTQLSKALDLMREQAPLILKDVDTRMMKDAALDMSGKTELSINLEHMIRDQANQIEQLQYNAKFNEKRVISLAGHIECMQLGSNTKACPAEMDGVKEQILHSPCRWSYRTKNVNVGRVTPLANGIARMQLEPSTKMNGIKKQRYSPYRRTYHTTNVNVEKATPLANNIEYTKLEPNTEACSGPNTHLSNIENLLLIDSRPSPIIAKYSNIIGFSLDRFNQSRSNDRCGGN